MRHDIYKRLNKIGNEQVPKGYSKKREGAIIPSDWVYKLIKDICPMQRGFDLPSYDVSEGKYPVCYSNGVLRRHNDYKIVGPGVITGRSGTIGKVFFIEGNYWPHNTSLWVTDFKGNYPKYIYYLLKHIRLERFLAGTGVPTLNRNVVHIYKVGIPKDGKEQEKIANILSTWDNAIELKEKLIEQKKKQKKGLMQLLLTGKKRLKGFSGEWRKYKLGSLCSIKKGVQLNKLELDDKGAYAAINGGIGASGYTDLWNTEANKITISEGGNSCGFVNYITEKFWCGGHCYVLEINKILENNIFLFHILKFNQIKIMRLRVGSGLPNIQKKDLSNFILLVPNNEEQTAIANVLSTADKEIELHEKQLGELKKQKKGLMQLLLTGIVRVN